jgi:Tfp pilus assembly protein PilF
MMRNDAEDQRQAEEYIQKALALEPDSAEAHASSGFILAMDKWQWREAEAEFQKAIGLDEDSAKAHQWYATLLAVERRFDEAETHLKRAIEIEPLSPNYNADLCELYFLPIAAISFLRNAARSAN